MESYVPFLECIGEGSLPKCQDTSRGLRSHNKVSGR